MKAQEEFWTDYYATVFKDGNAWLDYSNERVQAQTFGLVLEAAGPVRGLRCLDIGCGWGQFCRALAALGASSVTGVDIVPDVIASHERNSPHIRWLCGSPRDAEFVQQLEVYDIVFLLEVLQYLPFPEAIRSMWSRVAPAGRLVAVVPNANCSIVSRARERFGTSYSPPTMDSLHAELSKWADVEHAAYRGLSFRTDQQLVPYDVSPWRASGEWRAEPNRIQFVAVKARGAAGG